MANDDLRAQMEQASEVQSRYADYLMSKPNVVGVALGFARRRGEETPQVSIVVMVEQKVPSAQLAPEDVLPRELDGVRVDVQTTGDFSAFST